MQVYKKVSLVLVAITAILLSTFVLFGLAARNESTSLLEQRSAETESLIQNLIELKSNMLKTLSYDYTYWDEMVNFIQTADPEWALQNIDEGLRTYAADAAWVYRMDGSLVYSKSMQGFSDFKEAPLTRDVFSKLFQGTRFEHFFIQTPHGLLEIRGATAHPTADPERKTNPKGYFLVGKLWDKDWLDDLSQLTFSEVKIVSIEKNDQKILSSKSSSARSDIHFTRILKSAEDRPIAQLEFIKTSPIIDQMRHEDRVQFKALMMLLTLLLLTAMMLLQLWVNRPLSLIEKALKNENPAILTSLKKQNTEFGAVSILIQDFFTQKEELLRQIKERTQLEATLVESQKMEALGKMAGAIAHDFNNQLTAIHGFCELLASDIDETSPQGSYLKEIQKATNRSIEFTSQLLSFSHHHLAVREALDLNIFIQKNSALIRHTLGEQIQLELSLHPKLTMVEVSITQLEQVLMNVVLNARDAMPSGGKLFIKTLNVEVSKEDSLSTEFSRIPPGAYVELEIMDSGVGMSEEVKKHLFEPFYTTKERGKGTGLGLASAYSIIKQHNGYITVVSQPGQGSAVKMFFPPCVKKAAALPQINSQKPIRGGNEVILMAEDEDGVRAVASAMMRKYGYQVLAASQGKEALELAQKHSGEIHLLLSDVIMPGMDGKELYGKLKVRFPHLKVIFMSGYTSSALTREAFPDLHMNLLQKPFQSAQLLARIRQVLDS